MFLGVFAKLRKATINFMSARLSAYPHGTIGSHWMNFHKI